MPPSCISPLTHIGFTRVEPSREYSEIIECYWFINTNKPVPINTYEQLHADGGHGIILNYAQSFTFENKQILAKSFFDGTNTISRTLGLHGKLNAVGIRFKPTGASLQFSFPLNEIKNKVISLDDLNIPFHSDLYNRVNEAPTVKGKASAIEYWLSQAGNHSNYIPHNILESIKFIHLHKGTQAISSLEKHLGYSKRKIERLFNAQTGMSAKEYSTNLRMEFARNLIKSNNKSLTEIAHELGYYDQAHFIKQFRKNIGITPGEYLMKQFNTRNRSFDTCKI